MGHNFKRDINRQNQVASIEPELELQASAKVYATGRATEVP